VPALATLPRPLLIAAEGTDGSGKSGALERLARWLERRGRPVSVVAWSASPLVRAAATSQRSRIALTPTVAALLAAADDVMAAERMIRPRLVGDRVVLVDRYAWTAVARDIARGLDPGWAGALRRPLPAPDLVILFRSDRAAVVARALADRPASTATAAVTDAFGGFVDRLLAAYDGLLASSAGGAASPWPVPVTVIEGPVNADQADRHSRTIVRPLLDGAHLQPGLIRADVAPAVLAPA
jgi:thymidylate kinase